MPTPRLLNYARAAPWHANPTLRRLTLVVAVSALFLGLCWGAWTGFLRDRIAFAKLWHRSENFAEPPTTVIYTNDTALVPQLLKTGYLSSYLTPSGPIDAWRRPTLWSELEHSMKGGSYFYPCPFLHARIPVGHHSRMVVVQLAVQIGGPDVLGLRVWPETLVWSWPPHPHFPSVIPETAGLRLWVKRHEAFAVYAGQPDPADSSHFTIGYVAGGKTGTIDGRLNADGTVTLTIRDGPLFGRTEDSFN